MILYNCALSLLMIQERFDNDYYLQMDADSGLAPDLLNLYLEEQIKRITNAE